MDEFIKSAAEIVRSHRKKAGLSRNALAKLADTGKKAIFDLEHGKKTIQLDTLLKILGVLNITLRLESPLTSTLPSKS